MNIRSTNQNQPAQEAARQRWMQHMIRRHGVSPQAVRKSLSRRDFLKLAGVNALAFGAALAFRGSAQAHGSGPKPIPGGIQPFGPGTPIFHVLLPGYPPFGSPDPAENDPSVITDFNGHSGIAFVQGIGTRTDLETGETSRNVFEVDLRFMQGVYIAEDGERRYGTFAFTWLDVFEGEFALQIHDFNPGIHHNGVFWLDEVEDDTVWVNPGNGRAVLHVEDLPTKDYGDIVNALFEGPFIPGTCSFRCEWSKSDDKHHFHHEPSQFDGDMVFNTAQAWWKAETEFAHYETDDLSTSYSLFAEVGHERNGAYFPSG